MLCCGNAMQYGKYSIQINKNYCNKHGYNFYVEKNILDNTKHQHGQKFY